MVQPPLSNEMLPFCRPSQTTTKTNTYQHTCTRYHHIIMNFAMKQNQEFYPLNTNSTNMHQPYVGQGACLQVSGTLCRLVLPSWHTKAMLQTVESHANSRRDRIAITVPASRQTLDSAMSQTSLWVRAKT